MKKAIQITLFVSFLSLCSAVPFRAMNYVILTPSFDVKVDNEVWFTNVTYDVITKYKEISHGDHTILITYDGGSSSPYQVTIEEDDPFTVGIGGAWGLGVELVSYQDNLTQPSNGHAMVRVIQYSYFLPDVDIYFGNTMYAIGLSPSESSGYMEVEAIPTDITVKLTQTSTVFVSKQNVPIQEGYAYTIIVNGYPNIKRSEDGLEPKQVPADQYLQIAFTVDHNFNSASSVSICASLLILCSLVAAFL